MGTANSQIATQTEQKIFENTMASPRATFAAGCYWGTENFFKKEFQGAILEGAVGFMGGPGSTNPGYDKVCSGTSGHAEVYSFTYDAAKVDYLQLVSFFFQIHNPTTKDRQGNDRGTQYRSSIFFHNAEQQAVATEYIRRMNDGSAPEAVLAGHRKAFGGGEVVSTIEEASTFWPAHEDHQEYLVRNPQGYCNHRRYYRV